MTRRWSSPSSAETGAVVVGCLGLVLPNATALAGAAVAAAARTALTRGTRADPAPAERALVGAST